jgi:hypothetical protein
MNESGPAERVQPAMHQHVGILTGGTLVSAAYAVGLWGILSLGHWAAAAIFVLLIYVHELGHVVAARRYHVPWTTAPVFALSGATRVPMYATPADPVKATAFYLSGPVLGALGAVLAIACGQVLVWSPVFHAGVAGVVWNWSGVLPLPPRRIRTDGTVVLGILALAGRAGARRRILGIYLAVLAILSLLLVLEHQPILAFTGSTSFSGFLKTYVLVCVALIVVQLLAGIVLRRHWVPPRGVPGRQLILGLLDWLTPPPPIKS